MPAIRGMRDFQTTMDTKTDEFDSPKPEAKDPKEIVKFKFINQDAAFVDPKSGKKFDFEFSFNGIKYKMIDGKVHEAPREVMEHLNGRILENNPDVPEEERARTCAYPVYGKKVVELDGRQATIDALTGWNARFLCVEM